MSILLRASSPLLYVVSWSGRVHHCVNLDDAAKAHVHPKILDIFVAANGYSIKSLLCRTSHPFHFSQPKAKSLALLASRRALDTSSKVLPGPCISFTDEGAYGKPCVQPDLCDTSIQNPKWTEIQLASRKG